MLADALRFPVLDYELIPLEQAKAHEIADYQLRNRERFQPFAPFRTEAFFTSNYWRAARRRAARERRELTALRWLLVDGERVIGQITLDHILRGAHQSGVLGYSLDAAHEGRGLMTASLERIIAFSFSELKLHRLRADHVPDNLRSAAVLQRLGFEREGLSLIHI